jgi:hypothetical protein
MAKVAADVLEDSWQIRATLRALWSAASYGGSNLIATVRLLVAVSCTRHTSPMQPPDSSTNR